MEAVFALADRITVLVYGRVIASGAPGCDPRQRRRAPGLSRRGGGGPWLKPCSTFAGIETAYGLSQVLFGVSLSVGAGEMVTLMGRNGMGKTTTVRSIMGLTPARAGTHPLCRRGHRPAAALPGRPARHRARAGGAADLPQSHRARKPAWRRRPRAPAPGRWTRSTRCFRGLPSATTSMGNQLSGGEQQMLAIGRALMTNPRLLDPRRGDRGPGAADPRRDLALPGRPQGVGPRHSGDRQECRAR